MQIGVIGLGHMGGNISRRLMKAGHRCVVFDANAKTREALAKEGAAAAGSLAEVVKALGDKPRAVWVMFLYARFRSREEHTFGEKMLSAMRVGFSGHIEGNEPIDPQPKPAELQGHSAAQNAEE